MTQSLRKVQRPGRMIQAQRSRHSVMEDVQRTQQIPSQKYPQNLQDTSMQSCSDADFD